MKQKKLYSCIIFVMLILVITLAGCHNNQELNASVTENSKSTTQKDSDKEIETNIIDFIKSKDSDISIKDFKIVYKQSVDQGNLIMILYENSDKLYEGLFFVESTENKVMNGDFTEVDKSAAFTQHELSGNLRKLNTTNKNSFLFVGGVINNDKIDMINIYFNDNSLASLKIDKNLNIYSYAKTDKFISIKSIEGLDADGNTVFAYSN